MKKNKSNRQSNAKMINFPDLERLNLTIETLTDSATKDYVNELLAGIELMKAQNEITNIDGYGAALYDASEKMYLICRSKGITDMQISKMLGKSNGWVSECRYPLEHSRARKPETTYKRLYNIIQARKNALFTLFASRTWAGVDADKFVQDVGTGELKM